MFSNQMFFRRFSKKYSIFKNVTRYAGQETILPLISTHSINRINQRYNDSITKNCDFWRQNANDLISWFRPFDTVQQGSFIHGDIAWFVGGKLNASYNCIDRHLPLRANQTAIIWEGDEPNETQSMTYLELHHRVCRLANLMTSYGIRKGDVVTVYLPMIPQLAIVMLACSRIGAIHSVVFAGFSATSLSDRIMDCKSKFVFTCYEGKRGGKSIPLLDIAKSAIQGLEFVQNLFVFDRLGVDRSVQNSDRQVHVTNSMIQRFRPYSVPEAMDSEDPLFVLYTSGSTGKPKGLVHTIAGYLVHISMTIRESFDLKDGDVFGCMADVGWITGHSYVVYGPLLSGSTTIMFESTPLYPTYHRYWDLIDKHRVTQFYTSPTAIRSLMKHPTDGILNYSLTSLRILGTAGEPINPEAWRWYYHNIGRGKCSVVDTWWQTETGGIMTGSIPNVHPMVPGACAYPMLGIQLAILDDSTGKEILENELDGLLVVKHAWPSIARTIVGDHSRYLDTYMKPYPGYYLTGDRAMRDVNGHYWIMGRDDDVMNPSGHLISSAEVEHAVAKHISVAESAVVGVKHDLKGESIVCFVVLKAGTVWSSSVEDEIKLQVKREIGGIAVPDRIVNVPDLPKTRSGKVMRRLLRIIISKDTRKLGDTSTLADPSVVDTIMKLLE